MFKKLFQKLRKKSKYLYRSGWDLTTYNNATDEMASSSTALFQYVSEESDSEKEKMDDRIEKKPIEVFKEIISNETPKMDLNDIDGQIKLVEKRIKVLSDYIGNKPNDEFEALKFLKARKKFSKHKERFSWNITTHALVKKLCDKYKVRMVDFSSYYKNVPMEAIDELEKYYEAYKKVRDDEPVVKLIIDDGGKETKKDPIVLTSSPFGYWFYVIGAWDKEVEIIDELFYRK